MKTIELTKEQLNNMRVINDSSFESIILEYKKNYVIKYFRPYISKEKLRNKQLKLMRIAQKNIPGNIITRPLSLINVDGSFSAYLMKKEQNNTLKDVHYIDTIFELYIDLFNKLDYLHNHGISICDLKPENILVPGGIFCDIDSMGVDELKPCYCDKLPPYAYRDQAINYKLAVNDMKKIDYLLLLYCFLNSLDDYKSKYEDFFTILEKTCLSKKTKSKIKKVIKKVIIKEIPDFNKILILERELYERQL